MVFAKPTHSGDKILIGPKKKTAFVCSGGATKAGAFHLGVALALQEQGFKFQGGLRKNPAEPLPSQSHDPMEISCYVGSSAGSIVASYLACGYSLENIFNSFLTKKDKESISEFEKSPKVLSRLTYQRLFKLRPELAKEQIHQFLFVRKIFSNLIKGNLEALLQLKWLKITGLFSTSGIEQYLREDVLLSNRFQDYCADLFVVATQLNQSKKTVFGKYKIQLPERDENCEYDDTVDISKACAASAALPFIYAPYPIKNEKSENIYYIDGEIRDTLSTHVAVDSGADLVIASYTHQPFHTSFEASSLTNHGLPAILIQSIYLLVEQKINQNIYHKQNQKKAILDVSKYCIDQGISDIHRKKICDILEKDLRQNLNVEIIHIHPSPHDSQVFFREHFSLSPRKMSEVVRSGFRAAIKVLEKYEFSDRKVHLPIGTTQSGADL